MFCTISLFKSDIKQIAYALLIGAIAALLGWGVGTFFSPYEDESETFSSLWTTLTGVASGAAITKAYDFLSAKMNLENSFDVEMLCRIGLGFGWLILFAMHTFLTRHYAARLEGRNRVVVNSAVIKDIQKKLGDIHKAASAAPEA